MQKLRILFYTLLIGLMTFSLVACDREGPAERTGKAMDEAAEETREGVQEAEEAMDEAAQEAEEALPPEESPAPPADRP